MSAFARLQILCIELRQGNSFSVCRLAAEVDLLYTAVSSAVICHIHCKPDNTAFFRSCLKRIHIKLKRDFFSAASFQDLISGFSSHMVLKVCIGRIFFDRKFKTYMIRAAAKQFFIFWQGLGMDHFSILVFCCNLQTVQGFHTIVVQFNICDRLAARQNFSNLRALFNQIACRYKFQRFQC